MPSAALEALGAGATVITGGHGLAAQLVRRHDHAQWQAGRRAWPAPDVLSLDAWLRRCWEEAAVAATPAGARRLLTPEEVRILWHQVIGGAVRPGTDVGLLVPLAMGAWRAARDFRLDLDRLRHGADTEDARAFCAWAIQYQHLLAQRGWLDPADLAPVLAADLAAGHLAPPAQVVFAAVDPWSPALEMLAGSLAQRGTRVHRLWPAVEGARAQVLACADAGAELRQAAAWARACRAAAPDATIAVLVPDLTGRWAQVRRAFLDHLAPGWQLRPPAPLPLVLGSGRRLRDYPVVHAALALLQAARGPVSFGSASQLLRSPFLPGAQAEGHGRARAELALRSQCADNFGLAELVRVAASPAPRLAQCLRELAKGATAPGGRLPPSQWSAAWWGLLQAVGWPGDRALDDDDLQVVAAFRRALEAYGGCDAVSGLPGFGPALAQFSQVVTQRSFEPDGGPGAIAVLGDDDVAGQTFDHLWVCGLEADRWPGAPRPHSLLGLALQRTAGLPAASPESARAEGRARFAHLAQAASRIVFSWARQREQADNLQSPLLAGLPELAPPPGFIPHPDRTNVAGSSVTVPGPPERPAALVPGGRLPGGAGTLSLQAICPARAFIAARLDARPLEAPPRPLDGAMRGQVVHQLLQQLYAREPCRHGLGTLAPPDLEAEVRPLAAAILATHLPGDDRFLTRLRAREVQRLLALVRQLSAWDQPRQPFTVATEESRELLLAGLRLQLRLDRVDRLHDGSELVLDYKTGARAGGGWNGPRLRDCQLPLYALTGPVAGVALLHFRPDGLRIRGLAQAWAGLDGLPTADRYCREEGLSWEALRDRWRGQLESLVRELVGGDFRVNPAELAPATGQFAALIRIHDDPRLQAYLP